MSPRDWRKRTWDGLHKVSGIALRNGKVLGQVAHAGYKAYKKQKLARMESTLSNQYNAAVIYRRKKQGRKARRKVSFARRVQRALQSTSSEKTIQLMRHWASAAAAGIQNVRAFSLYGGGGSDNDVMEIFNAYSGTTTTSWDYEVAAKSAHVDYLCTNVGSFTMVLKVYTVIPKENVPYSAGTTIGDCWARALANTLSVTGTFIGPGDGLASTAVLTPLQSRPGATPFDATGFCQRFTILKVSEFILSPGQTASFNDNMMRQGTLNSSDIISGGVGVDNVALRGWTKSHIFVHHGIATSGAVSSLATFYPASSLGVIANKTYKFTVTEYKNAPEIGVEGSLA